jgi:hypothetical protein
MHGAEAGSAPNSPRSGGQGEKGKQGADEKLSPAPTVRQTLYLATFYCGHDLHAYI